MHRALCRRRRDAVSARRAQQEPLFVSGGFRTAEGQRLLQGFGQAVRDQLRVELGVPVRFIGLGEKMEDLEEFDLDKYLYGLLVGKEEE